MAIEFDCPQCNKELFAQDQFAGREIECPQCRARVRIPAASSQQASGTPTPATTPQPQLPGTPGPAAPPQPPAFVPPPKLSDEALFSPPPQPPAAGGEKPCPMCGETIKAEARKCRFCGTILDSALKEQLGAQADAGAFPAWRGGRGHLEFGPTLDVGFASFQKFWAIGAVILLIFYVLSSIGSFIAQVLVGVVMAGVQGMGGGAMGTTQILAIGSSVLASTFLVTVFQAVFVGGLWKVAISMADSVMGRPVEPQVGDLFAGLGKAGTLIGISLIQGVVTTLVGAVLLAMIVLFFPLAILAVPIWIWINTVMFLSMPLAMERDLGAVEAVQTSVALTRGNVIVLVLTMFVAGLIGALGVIGCLVGALFTCVILLGSMGSVYRQLAWVGPKGEADGGFLPPAMPA
ncbi:MAG: hypothetical protein M5U26_20900 [Planctomycetota bacterium]|nr:hypothetical protein [Planctomycetota bacterium]